MRSRPAAKLAATSTSESEDAEDDTEMGQLEEPFLDASEIPFPPRDLSELILHPRLGARHIWRYFHMKRKWIWEPSDFRLWIFSVVLVSFGISIVLLLRTNLAEYWIRLLHPDRQFVNSTWNFWEDDAVREDYESYVMGTMCLCLVPMIWVALPIIGGPANHPLLYVAALVYGFLRYFYVRLKDGAFRTFLLGLMYQTVTILLVAIWCKIFDLFDRFLQEMAKSEAELIEEPRLKKNRQILHSEGVTSSGDAEKDALYSYPDIEYDKDSNFSSIAIAYMWPQARMLSRVVALSALFFTICLEPTTALYGVVGILYGFMSLFAGYELFENFSIILKFMWHKPFYIGELISLGAGSLGSPEFVTGFVERVTVSYLIIRDFKSFQVWVPMSHLRTLPIKNWSRRSWKVINLKLFMSGQSDPENVDKLAKFAESWILSSDFVQEVGYYKCCLARFAGAYELQAIFYPRTPKLRNEARQTFIVTVMKAAKRLGVAMANPSTVANVYIPEGTEGGKHNLYANGGLSVASARSQAPVLGQQGTPDLSDLVPPGPQRPKRS